METFGRYLVKQRELRGMSRDDVVRATKLSPASVDALEGDRPDALPARVFVVGYIRAYAACIGLAPDEAVLRYDEQAQARGEAGPEPASRGGKRRGARLAFVVAGIAALAAGAAWAVLG